MKRLLESPKILLIILLCILLMPLLISQSWLGQYLPFGEGSAWLGDTMGGLTTPFIGLLSSFLVYAAFQQQVDANLQQRKANEDTQRQITEDNIRRNINEQFEKIKYYFKSFKFNGNLEEKAIDLYFKSIIQHYQYIISAETQSPTLLLTNNESYDDVIKLHEARLRGYVSSTRELMVLTSLCLSHIRYLEKLKNQSDLNSELKIHVELSIDEFTLLYLNAFDLNLADDWERVNGVQYRHSTHGTDQVILTLFELDSKVDRHVKWA